MQIPTGYDAAGGLGLIAMMLNRQLGDDMRGTTLVRSVDGHLELKELGDASPLAPFLGMVAPDNWDIVGVVAHGAARNVVDGRTARGRLVHLVTRLGDEFTLNQLADEDRTLEWRCSARDGLADGPIADALRRVFDLPTVPPGRDVADLRFAVMMGTITLAGVEPVLAAWMDDGFFYRAYEQQITNACF
ncbi:MAG TPA: hypothetical protein VHD87_12840 [Acidimicrobiales bacterium]|nr:hypothetical protein [Acidimicrobiales bacterium]